MAVAVAAIKVGCLVSMLYFLALGQSSSGCVSGGANQLVKQPPSRWGLWESCCLKADQQFLQSHAWCPPLPWQRHCCDSGSHQGGLSLCCWHLQCWQQTCHLHKVVVGLEQCPDTSSIAAVALKVQPLLVPFVFSCIMMPHDSMCSSRCRRRTLPWKVPDAAMADGSHPDDQPFCQQPTAAWRMT